MLIEAYKAREKIMEEEMSAIVVENTKKALNGLVEFRKKTAVGMPTNGIFTVVGDVKTGKSEFLADVCNNLDGYVLSLEKEGMDHIDGRIHDLSRSTLAEFSKTLLEVIEEPSIKVIGIDTIDAVAEMVGKDVAAKFGIEHLMDRKKGIDGFAVWGEFGNRMKKLITMLIDCQKLVVLTAHYKTGEVNDNGVKTSSAKLAISGQAGEFLAYHSKLIGNTYKEDSGEATKYMLSFKGGPVVGQFGSRVEEVQDKIIELPKGKGYEAFADLFKTKESK